MSPKAILDFQELKILLLCRMKALLLRARATIYCRATLITLFPIQLINVLLLGLENMYIIAIQVMQGWTYYRSWTGRMQDLQITSM